MIDEASDQSLAKQTLDILWKLKAKKSSLQILLFSATFTSQVNKFADKFAPNANKIEVKREELTLIGVKQFWIRCSDNDTKLKIF